MRWDEKPVYISCGATDMRKSINGLMGIVKDSFDLDPFQRPSSFSATGTGIGLKSWNGMGTDFGSTLKD